MKKIFFASLILLLFTQCNKVIQVQLEAAAEAVNAMGPQQIDEITRLDSCTTKPNALIYHYTLELGEDADQLSVPIFELYQEKELLTSLKGGDKNVQKLLDTGVDLVFTYYDKGEAFASIKINKSDINQANDLKNDSTVYKKMVRLTSILEEDFPQTMLTGSLLDITTIYPRTLEMNVEESVYTASAQFDSVSFKNERMDEYFESLKENLFSDYLGGNANIVYRYIFKDKDGNYLTTIESTIKEYENTTDEAITL